jgi:hypothetical protein
MELSPEHALWVEVLKTFLSDARARCTTKSHKCKKLYKKKILAEMRHDASWICELIGVDYDDFRAKVKKAIFEKCPIHD